MAALLRGDADTDLQMAGVIGVGAVKRRLVLDVDELLGRVGAEFVESWWALVGHRQVFVVGPLS
jgi:hypothetical protein